MSEGKLSGILCNYAINTLGRLYKYYYICDIEKFNGLPPNTSEDK